MVLETSAGKGLRFNFNWGGSETTLTAEHFNSWILHLLGFNGLKKEAPLVGAEREMEGLRKWVVGRIRVEGGRLLEVSNWA